MKFFRYHLIAALQSIKNSALREDTRLWVGQMVYTVKRKLNARSQPATFYYAAPDDSSGSESDEPTSMSDDLRMKRFIKTMVEEMVQINDIAIRTRIGEKVVKYVMAISGNERTEETDRTLTVLLEIIAGNQQHD